MTRLIIVEGADNTGKSTLCQRLHNEFRAPVIRSHRDWIHWDEGSWYWLQTKFPEDGLHVIFDRWQAVSEPIYGPILRPERTDAHDWNSGLVRGAIEALSEAPAVVIFCVTPNSSPKAELEGVRENMDVLLARYHEYMALLRDNGVIVLEYDHRMSEDGFLDWLVELRAALDVCETKGAPPLSSGISQAPRSSLDRDLEITELM